MMNDSKHRIEAEQNSMQQKPTKQEVENAVSILLRWIGEDPEREGLKDTPKRVARAYEELFSGYQQKVEDILTSFFEEIKGYDDPILIKDIPFYSYCEHHIVPIIGKAHISYIPSGGRVVGLSKIPRIVDIFAKRLQTQEALTAQITQALMTHVKPKGVACLIEAEHMCMAMRGIKKQGSVTITTNFLGNYHNDTGLREEFFRLLGR